MEVVPLASAPATRTATSLPTLAVPSGATQKRRKRHNDLDELEDELLRIQIRQHFGRADAFSTAGGTSARERRYREKRKAHGVVASSSSSTSSETVPLTGSGATALDAFDVTSLGVALFASPRARVRLADACTLVKRLLWVSDEDMSEEINENDPKIVAGKQFLQGVEAFSMLSENELAQLVGLSELRAFKGGDVVIQDERESDGLYVVLSGTAARFPLPSAVDVHGGDVAHSTNSSREDEPPGDEYASESFAYQDHFGTIISPTEAAQTDRAESAVVATSDELECFWIPELVVRMLNVQPRMEHEFALVLHNHRFQADALQRDQEALVARLLRAGLHVTVLANTRNTTNCIVLLLSAPLWLLAREDKLLAMERIVEHQSAEEAALLEDESYESHAETLSASDRVAAFASILTRPASDKPPGVGLQGIEHNQDAVVKDVFPLHDPSMTDFILSTWFKETHSASTKRLFLLRIKDYFGLRIAFFTAFVRLYNAALVYPLNAGCLLWIFWRWIHYRTYVQALGAYGLCVAFVWAPTFLKRWLRYQNSLLVEWNLLGAKEVALPNLQFKDYAVETVNVAAPHEPPDLVEVKSYDHRRRWPKYAFFGLFCFVCLVLLFVFVGFYVQWYIIAVMTPMCTDPRCPEFLDKPGGCEAHCHELFALGKNHLFMQHITSCSTYCNQATFDRAYYRCDKALVGCFATERGILGTARWFYVLLQGVVLGLTLDIVFLALFEAIASGFNAWENYATEQEKETRLVEKIFLFNWVGYFYWFLLLAFLYVPNGASVQAFIRDHIDSHAVFTLNDSVRFSRYWVDGLISMDSAFVTPMIVTQALNLVINTFVPYLLRRAIVRARDSYHVKKERFLAHKHRPKKRARPHHKLGFNSIDVSELSAVATDSEVGTASVAVPPGGADDDPENAWLAPADLAPLDRREVATMLAQRAPVSAEQLETSVRALFSGISSHESHMQEICGALAASDLDSHQKTSYDWLDRVTRNLEERGGLKGLWQEDANAAATPGAEQNRKLRLVTQWQCRNYNYTADRILEESSMPIYSPEGDLLHLAIQFSYTILFSVVWPFCCLCAFARNAVALRFDAIKMTIDCKRPIPRRTIGIGKAWLGALLFEILAALVIVPGLFVYVSGQLDAFYRDCEISESRYGPAPDAEEDCGLGYGARLQAFVALENVGIALGFLIYLKKGDMSHETAIKVVAHSRRLKHHVRKSVRAIGETVLVGVASTAATSGAGTRGTYSAANSPERQPSKRSERDLLVLDEASPDDGHAHGSGFTAVDLYDSRAPVKPVHPLGTLHRRRTHGVLEMAQTKGVLDSKAYSNVGAASVATASVEPEWPLRTAHIVEWREGTVAWVKGGRLKVNFSGGRQLSNGGIAAVAPAGSSSTSSPVLPYSETEVWLANQETYVIMEPTPVQIFELGMPVLLASRKFGRWHEASVVALDTRDRFGKPLTHTPNEMHVKFVEAQNLRTHGVRHAALMDPYCVLTVSGAPRVRHASSVKRSTLNPVWDESVVFPLSERELYGTSSSDLSTAVGTTTTAIKSAAAVSSASDAVSAVPSAAASAASSRSASHAVLDRVPTACASGSATTLSAAVSAAFSSHNATAAGVGAAAPRRTLKISVLNNDAFAKGECVGEVELDLNQLRDGACHRLLVPLSQKRHIWTLDAVQSVMRKQALGGVHYPMLGLPHLLVELQWVDTRLPTKVTVRLKGQPPTGGRGGEIVLSRKFCETNLCYGVDPDRVAQAGAAL